MGKKKKTEIVAYETTPYGLEKVEGGFVVRQSWWCKTLTPVIKKRAKAQKELVKIAKEAGCYRAIRRKIKK